MGLKELFFGEDPADEQRELQQEAINKQYEYDQQRWQFDRNESLNAWRFAKEGLKIAQQNEQALINFNYATAVQGAQFQQALQDFQFKSQMRQYNKSEDIFKRQTQFNKQAAKRQLKLNDSSTRAQLTLNMMAANNAFSSENRKQADVINSQAYQKQDLFVKLMQEEGTMMARGVSGKSAAKGGQSILAEYGRNQAILADSLVSASKEYKSNLRDIRFDRYVGDVNTRLTQMIADEQVRTSWQNADLQALSNRMLKPKELPNVPNPLKQPESILQSPYKPAMPPRPIKGTNTVVGQGSPGLLDFAKPVLGLGITAATGGLATPLGIATAGATFAGGIADIYNR